MAQVDSTKLIAYCTDISHHVREALPHLDLHFLIYQPGEKAEKITRLLPYIKDHPAWDEAASILKFKTIDQDRSGFLGLAHGLETIHLRLKKERKKSLAFIALNTSQYSDFDSAVMDVHFFTAQMIDMVSKNNPHQQSDNTPHCVTNLTSDIYSILQMTHDHKYDAAQTLTLRRSIETLTPQSFLKPEDYPTPLALDVINYTINNQLLSSVIGRGTSRIISQFQLAHQISKSFEIENLQTWTQFANACQTMAWSGFSASQILGASVYTSNNPFIKSMGHLLSELTNLAPVGADYLPIGYNPFVADEINRINHERVVDETFEMVLIHTIEADSHLPFIRVANNQNEALLKGKISGWCANALQASAKAYVGAKERGIPPAQAAKLEFQSVKGRSNWQCLTNLHQHIIHLYRNGQQPCLETIIDWCSPITDAKFIAESVSQTQEDHHSSTPSDSNSSLSKTGLSFSG